MKVLGTRAACRVMLCWPAWLATMIVCEKEDNDTTMWNHLTLLCVI